MPNLPKIFERHIFKQKSHFLISSVVFIKVLSTQQCQLVLLEKKKRSVDRAKAFGALLTDLSKAFDCLDHELLSPKLNAYRLSLPALRIVHGFYSEWRLGSPRVDSRTTFV